MIPFSERYPESGQTVVVASQDWEAPRVATFTDDFMGSGVPRLLGRDGLHYWYPERMCWRPYFEAVNP